MSDPTSSSKHEQFMALFVRYEPGIHSYLTSLLANLDDAEEVMQETSTVMWKKFGQFEAGTSFRHWAFQIARYEAMNFRRKRARDRHAFSDELVRLLADDAARQAAQLDEERRALAQCVAKLSQRDRRVLSGCYRQNITIRAFAESVGRTPNAVRKHLARIRAALSLCVRQTLEFEGR
jgi:RNA polymerase sigma-70 factor (ECF subfamily)